MYVFSDLNIKNVSLALKILLEKCVNIITIKNTDIFNWFKNKNGESITRIVVLKWKKYIKLSCSVIVYMCLIG